jgi:hypothetical protein
MQNILFHDMKCIDFIYLEHCKFAEGLALDPARQFEARILYEDQVSPKCLMVQ